MPRQSRKKASGQKAARALVNDWEFLQELEGKEPGSSTDETSKRRSRAMRPSSKKKPARA